MARYARYDSSAPQPAPVVGWYDTDRFDYKALPPAHELVEVTDDAAWKRRLKAEQFVFKGVLTDNGPEKALADVKAGKLAALKACCQSHIVNGFFSDALGATHHYPSSLTDQTNLHAAAVASMVANLPTDWKTPFWCQDEHDAWAMRMHDAPQIQRVLADCREMIGEAQMRFATLTMLVGGCGSAEAVGEIGW